MAHSNNFYGRQLRKAGYCAGLLVVALLMQAAALSASGVARPQQPQSANKPDSQDQPIRLKTALVELHAVVTDKQGNVVTGLTKDDFELVENGHHQAISFFSAEDLRKEKESSAAPPPAPRTAPLSNRSATTAPPRRTVVFFVDTLNMENLSLMRLKQMMLKFIDERLGDEDMAAVVSLTGGLGIFGQFTHDKQVLRLAINRLSVSPTPWQGSFFTPYVAMRAMKELEVAEPEGNSLSMQMTMLPAGAQVAMNIVIEEDQPVPLNFDHVKVLALSRARNILFEATYRRRMAMLTLKSIANQLANFPGQRLILMFSDGFTMSDDSGDDDSDDLRAAISRASRSGVVVNAIAAKGLTGPSLYDAGGSGKFSLDYPGFNNLPGVSMQGDRELEHGMERVAAGTGGTAYLTTNDLKGAMEKSLDANSYYYGLSYYPTNLDEKNKKEFRTIKVRVKGHPEYKVQTQNGYLVGELLKAKEPPPADPMKALISAMGEPLAATGVNVAMTADYLLLPEDPAQASVIVYIDANRLEAKKEGDDYVRNLTLLTGILDSGGGTLGVLKDDIRIKLNEKQLAQSQAQQSMYRYTKRLTLKPGTYQIRVGVRDEGSGQAGTAAAWVEVPQMKKKKLALSGLILERGRAGGEGDIQTGLPDVRDGIAVFRQSDEIRYREWAYWPMPEAGKTDKAGRKQERPTLSQTASAGNADEAGGEALVKAEVAADEKMVIATNWRPLSSVILSRATGGAEFGERLKGGLLKPGYYTLRITVKAGPQAKEEIMRETMLQVVP